MKLNLRCEQIAGAKKPDRIVNLHEVFMSSLPDISSLDDSLLRVDAMMVAAEAHGALCGMLCARGTVELSAWIGHVLGDHQNGEGLHELARELAQLHSATLEQLNDAVADFHLLLPDDGDGLEQRVAALASWCQGYVYGLAAGGISGETELPADSRELLADFIEISRAAMDDSLSDDEEADEIAFVEISEYVRTGVLLVNEELQPLKTAHRLQ
jgi:hypothetical protein